MVDEIFGDFGFGSGFRREIRSEEHTSKLQSHSDLVCRLLLEKKKRICGRSRPARTSARFHPSESGDTGSPGTAAPDREAGVFALRPLGLSAALRARREDAVVL